MLDQFLLWILWYIYINIIIHVEVFSVYLSLLVFALQPPSVEEISCLSPLLSAVSLVPTMDIVYPWAPHGFSKPLSRIGVMKPLCEQTSMPHNCEGNAKPWVGQARWHLAIFYSKGIYGWAFFNPHNHRCFHCCFPSPLGQGAKAPCHHGAWQLLPIAVPAPRRALVLGDSKSLMQILKDIPP